MASNEVEVLDPAPTVEKLKKFASERVLNRRHFIAALGVAGAAAVGTELVRQGPTALAQQPKPNGYAQNDVLNFLLNINYLKATLYSFITQGADLPTSSFANLGSGGVYNPPAKITFTAAGPASATEITDMFNEMYYDELNQLIALRNLIGSAAIGPRATINFAGTGTTTTTSSQTVSPVSAIGLLRMLEDLAASAYAGATVYLSGTNLAYATQSMATSGFHAGALRLLAIQAGAPYNGTGFLTTVSPTTQTQNSFTGSLVAGSTTIYNFAPTNPITVGSIVSATGIPVNTTITSVNPPTVYTGTLSGTTSAPNNIVTNVAPTTGLVAGMSITGTGIPGNAVITNINGTTITLGVITGYSSLSPYTPILNGVTSVTGSGGFGMTLGTYTLAFTGGGGSGAAGTLTVLSVGTNAQNPGTYSINLAASGSGYITAPTVTAATGGTPPTLLANVPAMITTSTASVTLTPAYVAATTKSGTTLTFVSQTAGLIPGQLITGTNIPSNASIAQGGINASAGTVTLQNSSGTALSASATSSVAPSGVVTKGSAVITSVSSVSGVLFGAPISGTGIPAGATVAAIGSDLNGPNITFQTTPPSTATASTTGTSSVSPTAQLIAGSTTIQSLSSLSGLAAGDTVTGVGIPAGTTVTSVGGINTMVISNAATTSTILPATVAKAAPSAVLASGSSIISNVYPMTNLANGQLLVDAQGFLPPGTTITGVTASSNTLAISAPATGSTTLTTVANCTGTVVNSYATISSVSPASVFTTLAALGSPNPGGIGAVISGPNIPSGSIITAFSASAGTITINNFPTSAGGPEIVGAALTIQTGTALSAYTLQGITVTGPVTSTGLTITAVETVTPSLGTATLSQAATITGTSTLLLETADSLDVEPSDPGAISFGGTVTSGSTSVTTVSTTTGLAAGMQITGPGIPTGATIATVGTGTITLSAAATATTTSAPLLAYPANSAALAAAGPTALSGTSPSVYRAFFATAGGSTSSANNPPGAIFARTFSQVLGVLYGSMVAQTYEGGFFPVGIGGPINFV